MKILALDLATYTGYCIGDAKEWPNGKPISGSVRLRKTAEEVHVAAYNLQMFVDELIAVHGKPDLVAVEDYLNPKFQLGADAIISSIGLHIAIRADLYGRSIRTEKVSPARVRTHFCSQANAGKRSDTKRMVIRQAQLLGMIPRDCHDDNRADACAIWSWAAANFAGTFSTFALKEQW